MKKEIYQILRIFGSIARGEDTDESDLDVLVCAHEKPYCLRIFSLKEYLQDLLHIKVDVLAEEFLPEGFDYIKEEAINFDQFYAS